MTGSFLTLAIEVIVAGLLATTIGYCVVLNRRLTRLRGDEQALKAIIGELVTATEIAERAIGGLKATVRDCDTHLGERIRLAERFTVDMDKQLRAGRDVIERIVQITDAARPTVASSRPIVVRNETAAEVPARVDPATLNGFAGAGVAAFRAVAEQGSPKTGVTLQTAQALAERTRQRVAG